MSQITSSWLELYGAQTEAVGAIVATVTGYVTNKPAIRSANKSDEQFIDGGLGEAGGYELQMLASDFSSEPAKGTLVTCTGIPSTPALYVLGLNENDGIYYITIGSFSVHP